MNLLLLLIPFIWHLQSDKLEMLCADKWIIDSRISSRPIKPGDQVTLIHPDAKEADQIELHHRFGGMSLSKNGSFKKFNWKQCGNDLRPDYVKGKWQFNERTDIITISQVNVWEGEYKIIALSQDQLILEKLR